MLSGVVLGGQGGGGYVILPFGPEAVPLMSPLGLVGLSLVIAVAALRILREKR